MTQIAPYGTWNSPLTAARVTAGTLRFDHLVSDGDDLYWVEGRASEAGRYVVVRRAPDGRIEDVTPAGFNVRTRVHEYGGAAYTVDRGTVYFSNFGDQRLYRQHRGEAPEPLTREGSFYADACVDRVRERLLLVREDHTRGDHEPVNTIVAIGVDGRDERILVGGADFYSDPIVSPDGHQLAWLQWNHPNMPWDGTEVWVAAIEVDGSIGAAERVAGGGQESIFQPAWSPRGELYYVSDRSGFWNLYRRGLDVSIAPMNVEFGKPQWTFSQTTYCFIDADRVAATFTEEGRWRLAVVDAATGRVERVPVELEPSEGVRTIGDTIYFVGGSPTQPLSVAALPLAGDGSNPRRATVIRAASADRIPDDWISPAVPMTFVSEGLQVHAFYYAPRNPDFAAPADEKPPLLVLSHGGPTAATDAVLNARIQYWTSRGFAVLDVNYGGSTGFGRAYRDRLKGQWGIVDVRDCVNGARHLVAAGRVDPKRLMIRGGSAGGYTTLAALTFHDTFTAGASHYGVSDLEVLARDTHKFESRYLDSLVGPYPAARGLYHERSPIHFTDRLSSALILFQGLEDKVVPPNQSEMMADAVRRKGLPVAYVTFEGEQHGFRDAKNIVRALEAELFFYGAVFGFTPADPIPPVAIDNLARHHVGPVRVQGPSPS